MALDLGTVISAVEAVQKAIEIYNRVQDLPQQMEAHGKRMERQNIVLLQVESFVRKHTGGTDPPLQPGQRRDLMRIIGNVKENAGKVYELFERVEKDILSRTLDIQFRSKAIARIWFALVEKQPEKIQAIMDDIKHDREELRDYVGIINADVALDIRQLLVAKIKEAEAARKSEREKNKNKNNQPKPQPQPQTLTPPTPKPTLSISPSPTPKRPSPSPSPLPLHHTYKVLFVDPRNQARSVVAESLLLLLSKLTQSATTTPWRISTIASAGFFLKHKSDLSPVIASLPYSHPSYKFPQWDGNEPPNPVALAAVFDNTSYNYPFKSGILRQISTRRSVGLNKAIFKTYDYIIVFTNREHDNMVRLKEALIKSGDSQRGKGRVLHLGAYIPQKSGAPKEIITVTAKKDEKTGKSLGESRSDWNRKVSQIKTAIKGFLKDEMNWEMPDEKALKGKELAPVKAGG